MMIGCTKKAARKLKLELSLREQEEDAFFCWHAKIFEVYGEPVVLLMNHQTRFPIFMHQVYKEDMDRFHERFALLFKEMVCALQLPEEYAKAYLKDQSFFYVKVFDFSIMAQLQSLSRLYCFNVMHGVHEICSDMNASIRYAHIPCVKYDLYPIPTMRNELMKRYGNMEM